MARLDSLIDRLFKDGGAELIFESGAAAVVRGSGGVTPVLKTPLSGPQIVSAFAEIVPSNVKPGFPTSGVTQFNYQAPSGSVAIVFDRKSESQIRVVVKPSGNHAGAVEVKEERLELASPAEMLHMAAQGNPPASARPAAAPTRGISVVSGDARAVMDSLLAMQLEKKASDIHLSSDNPPMFRIDGDMRAEASYGVLQPARLKELLFSIAPEKNKVQWEEIHDTDFAYELPEARFRVNIFMDRKGIGAVLRQIPNSVRSAEEMGLSKQVLDLCFLNKGLVLVTGPTGSGKSTTLAAMIDYINRNREDHIITIEDPIEFVHPNKKCLVNQREIGVHTGSFKHALRAALREDPDIVLVGELRDLETIAIAIETAETGHLVFGTLHTNTAPSTVDRVIDQFPADRQEQIRMMLSESLRAVITQTLCKKIGGGRVPAMEILMATSSVCNLIREGKTFQIPSMMQTGKGYGMQTLNDALLDLVKKKLVEPNEAYQKAVQKPECKKVLEANGFKVEVGVDAV